MLRAPSQLQYAPIKRKIIRNKTINGSTIKIKKHSKISSKSIKHKTSENEEVLKATKCLILESSFFNILTITALSWQNKFINHCKTLCVFQQECAYPKVKLEFLELVFSNRDSSLPNQLFQSAFPQRRFTLVKSSTIRFPLELINSNIFHNHVFKS